MSAGISLRHLAFTGPAVEPASLVLKDGLNILYGASNTGKSFAVKALNFMLGGSKPLPGIEQRADFDAAWLGLVLPDGQEVTLYRSTSGGDFRLFDGLVLSLPDHVAGLHLAAKHSAKQHDNLSHYLLKTIGLDAKVIVKNIYGEKDSLSFRNLVPYMFVSEETIISERSPILASGQLISETAEKNIFKVLLTGHDDVAVVTKMTGKTHKIVREAKVEIVDELIAQIDEERGDEVPPSEDILHQVTSLEMALVALHTDLRGIQDKIDGLISRRRELAGGRDDLSARLTELDITLARFARLAEVYASDVARLEALEEGGFLLMTLAGRDCAVCGAPPDAQKRTHGIDEIERSRRAAAAEISKIMRESLDLQQTTASLSAESDGLRRRLSTLAFEIQSVEKELANQRPLEAQTRHRYETLAAKRADLGREMELNERRSRLEERRSQLEIKPKRGKKGDKLTVGIDGTTAFAFARAIQNVLAAWHFPGAQDVQFDTVRQDIQIGGKDRAANGKGIRALLHAAIKVATLIYCRERDLPHPGIVVLDTPLLTYREPLLNSKYGDLEEDERVIKNTSLAEHFYAHLASISNFGQVVVVENSDPPASALSIASVQTFTGKVGTGRFGLFRP